MDNLTRRGAIKTAVASTLALAAGPALAAKGKVPMLVHHDPNCGCCHKWAAIAERSGFAVTIMNSADIMSEKRKLGVPAGLVSCHTSEVGGYVVEGHVPMAAIHKLLRDKPKDIHGIALPGMPAGSPGMEVPGVKPQALKVMAFDHKGKIRAYSG